jgi:hypothetical protein
MSRLNTPELNVSAQWIEQRISKSTIKTVVAEKLISEVNNVLVLNT